jgi:steroid 5-alpha reductase family enzyme
MSPRGKGLVVILFAYLGATVAGCVAAWLLRDRSLLVAVAAGDVAATIVTFGFSFACDNSSVYDLYWSVAPLVIAGGLFGTSPHTARHWLVLGLVGLWSMRLNFHWVRGWPGLQHEDWRYVDMRRTTGKRYWLASFFGLHLVPTLITFAGGLAMFPVFASGDGINLVDVGAAIVMLSAVAIETTADEQLRRFRRTNKTPGRIMDEGLWSLCRHPNYVGEMTFWWGLWLFGVAADPGAWWTILGPLAVTGLIAGVSVRMIDERSVARRPGYAEHMKQLPAFIPRLFKRRAAR